MAYPILPQGVHAASLEEIEAAFVHAFKPSHRRAGLFKGYRKFSEELRAVVAVQAEYLDGSFVTGKPDPKDIDVSVWIKAEDLDALTPAKANTLHRVIATAPSRRLDLYVLPECDETHPAFPSFNAMLWTDHFWTRCRDSAGLTLSPHEFRKGYVRVIP